MWQFYYAWHRHTNDNVTENVYRLISFRLQRHEDNKLPDACLIHTRNTPITGPTIKT